MNRQEREETYRQITLWLRRRQLAIVEFLCLVVIFIMRRRRRRRNYIDHPISQLGIQREIVRDEIMSQINTNEKCHDIIRMGQPAFKNLCEILQNYGGLQPTQRATVEEQVAKFLHILSHNVRNRTISFFFRRSGETISRHFHRVLKAIISLEDQFLRQPTGLEVPPEILYSSRFYPYFKDCVGAIDGTHVRVKVSNADAPRYRGRKDYPTQNVLAACSFDLKFTYVLPGWKGIASDSRIIKNAPRREDKLHIPNGKYYLADAGFMLRSTLITPFRGVRKKGTSFLCALFSYVLPGIKLLMCFVLFVLLCAPRYKNKA